MKEALNFLNRLTDVALKNEQEKSKLPPTIHLPAKQKFLFGHKITIEPIEEQEMNFAIKQKIITDWQEAKNKVYNKLKAEDITPLAIVPENTFHQTLKKLKIVDLSGMDEQGNISINPFGFDAFLAPLVLKAAHDIPAELHIFLPAIKKLAQTQYQYFGKSFTTGGDWGVVLEAEPIKIRLYDDVYTNIVFRIYPKTFYESLLENKTNYESITKKLHENRAHFEDRFHSYSAALTIPADFLKDDINRHFCSEYLQGKIIFTELPGDFQKLLIKIKTKFPHWNMYTAADPEFFRIIFNGIDIYEYVQTRSKFWSEVWDGIVAKIPEVLKTNEHLQEKLRTELKGLGLIQKYNHFLMSEDDLLQAISKERDPIFYVPIEQEHKKVLYKMVIIWGQVGESPNELQAIKYLQSVDHSEFMGVREN